MKLKEFRKSLNITANEASNSIGIPLRTYVRYENDEDYGSPMKRNIIFQLLQDKFEINEKKGILSLKQIESIVKNVLNNYKNEISFCYLFGSYAKGYATEISDVDLCISTTLTGMAFVGLIEELRRSLKKKVDLLRITDLNDNIELINEIMKDGVKIYG